MAIVVVRWSDRVDTEDLLVAEASGVLGRPVFIEHRCRRCGADDHGQPLLVGASGLHASVARADGLNLVAFTEAGPIGVDIERVDAAGFEGFPQAAMHPDERAFTTVDRTRLWVRKEAVLKATGHGLGVDPRRVRMSEPRQPPALIHWGAADDPGEVWLADVPVTDGWLAAVAVITPVRHDIVLDQGPATLAGSGQR